MLCTDLATGQSSEDSALAVESVAEYGRENRNCFVGQGNNIVELLEVTIIMLAAFPRIRHRKKTGLGVLAHACNPSTLGG